MSGVAATRIQANKALRKFGFRQTLRGAIILGAIVGLVMGAQGAAYAKAFPDQASRAKLVTSLESVSAVNFLSGEVVNAATPASYAIYKSLATTVIITSVWGLLVTTRLLRGNEEDGRLELLASGATTKRRASRQLMLGYAGSFAVACLLAFVFIAALGKDPQVNLSASASAYMVAAVFFPALFFAALGVFTSQLALTRGRAVLYGLVPLVVLFVIRGAANSVASANWLKHYSPFGWSDLLNPVLGPKPIWMLPAFAFGALFVGAGLFWAGRRDLGASLLKQSDTARSRYALLQSPLALAVRRSSWSYVWWGIAVTAWAAFFAALANLGVNLANDSSAFRSALVNGSFSETKIKLVFLGVGTLFVATALLVMATLNLSSVRGEEAKGYLDNLLVQPTRRRSWILGRLALIVSMFTLLSLLTGLVLWGVGHLNHIDVSFSLEMQGAISLLGTLAITLGIGVFCYGFAPRLAAAAMSVFIGWAFIVDILKSFFHLSGWVTKTSFLHYVPADPSQAPNWSAIAWLAVLGLVLMALGVGRFTKRDIISE